MRVAVEHDLAARDLAVLGLEQAGDRLQRRRLAGAIGAEQRDDRALGHVEAEAAQDEDDVVIDDLDVAHGEERRGGLRGRWLRFDFSRYAQRLILAVSSPGLTGRPSIPEAAVIH